jgi:hypothetical protein
MPGEAGHRHSARAQHHVLRPDDGSPGSPSPGLNGWLSSSVGESPSAVAPAPKPLLELLRRSGRGWLSLSPDRAATSHLSARDRSAGSPILWVVRAQGDGTGVPFETALRMPVFLFITAFGA